MTDYRQRVKRAVHPVQVYDSSQGPVRRAVLPSTGETRYEPRRPQTRRRRRKLFG